MQPSTPKTKIAILGGGISGMATAHRLSSIVDAEITLIESSDRLGGMGTYFEREGKFIDCFYHCQMPSDEPLLQMIDDVGFTDELVWKPTRMGFIADGDRYPFNTAIDLLRFKPLKFIQRIRFGAVSLFLRKLVFGKDLENTRVRDWLAPLYSEKIWEKMLVPLFGAKFGAAAADLPGRYIWERMGREKNTAVRGYPKQGLKSLIDRIEESLSERGVEILKSSTVTALRQADDRGIVVVGKEREPVRYDYVVSTLAPPVLRQISEPSLLDGFNLNDIPYQGVVNALFFLKKPLDSFYWNPVVNCGTEFDGVVEMTELVDPEIYGGYHGVYTMKYCSRDSELFGEDDALIASRWASQLCELYPDLNLTTDDIADVKIFKAPFVEPLYPLGYADLKPKVNVKGSPLFLATSAQVYPKITAWNSSTGFAFEVAEDVALAVRGLEIEKKIDSAVAAPVTNTEW